MDKGKGKQRYVTVPSVGTSDNIVRVLSQYPRVEEYLSNSWKYTSRVWVLSESIIECEDTVLPMTH